MNNQWHITYSYKYDLASFCNLFTGSEQFIQLHAAGYEAFKKVIDSKPDFVRLAKRMQQGGFDPRIVLVSAFDLTDYNGFDIDKLCAVLEDAPQKRRLRQFYVDEEQLITGEAWQDNVEAILPVLSQMTGYIHHAGFIDYWKECCAPYLEQRTEEILCRAGEYNIIGEINSLLGPAHRLPFETVTLKLSHFSAPFGTKLRNQSFLADARWRLEENVAVALHEMIHPPFAREKIEKLALYLWDDDLLQEAYNSQPASTSYNTPLRFLEEHLTEGSHLYLGEKMGVVKSPLEYLVKHDKGSHVVSALLYDYLKRGAMDRVNSLEEAVQEMVHEGILCPGSMRRHYNRVYGKAGIKPAFS